MNAKGTNQALEAREGLSPRWGYPPSLVKRGYVGTPPKNFENLDCRRWLLGCSEQILTSNPWCKIAHFQELIFLKYETEIIFGIDVHMIVSLTYSPFHTYTLTQSSWNCFSCVWHISLYDLIFPGIALSVANVVICDFFSWLATEIGFWWFFWRLDFLV